MHSAYLPFVAFPPLPLLSFLDPAIEFGILVIQQLKPGGLEITIAVSHSLNVAQRLLLLKLIVFVCAFFVLKLA